MPVLLLFIPLLCVFILNVPKRATGGRIAPWVLGAVCTIQAALAISYKWQGWQGLDSLLKLPVEFTLAIDFTGAVVLFTIAMVAMAAIAVGSGGDNMRSLNLGNLTLMLIMGMNGVVMVRDLFTLYIFLEITAVASYILIAKEKKIDALEGAFKYLILSGVATVTMLAANALLFMQAGSLSYDVVGASLLSGGLLAQIALVMYVVAFCVKAGVAPFHGWLPGAYSAAPNYVSVLLAGIVTKVAGVYVIIRLMGGMFSGLVAPGQAFMALGAFSIVVGAFAAIGQTNMKRMLAYSSISQVGYIILAAGLGTPLALVGAMTHFFNHATFKSLLFVNAATVQEQTGTLEMDKLGGLDEKMKVTSWTSVIGFLSTAGVPPLSGFWSKLLIIMALAAAGQWFYAALALIMSLVTLGYFLIMQHKLFFGKLREGLEEIREGRTALKVTALALAALTVAVGLLFPLALAIMHSYGLV